MAPPRSAGAPPRAPTSSIRKKQWATGYASRTDLLQKIADMKKVAKFYDPAAARTRERRLAILRDFEELAEEHMGMASGEVWKSDTITDTQMQYLAGIAAMAKGVHNDKVEIGTLYETRDAFYWWNALMIDNFGIVYHKWHVSLTKWIHQVATEFKLSTGSWKKNSLTDAELSILFRVVMDSTIDADNMKQHYVAWCLSWITSVRPSSITVSPGYSATDTLPNGDLRGVDGTLRWSDIEWFKDAGRICFRLTVRFIKGSQDPYAEGYVDATRTFLFIPMKSRMELDLTLILLGIAVNRGLFSLDYAINTTDVFFKELNPEVLKQAVLVSADEKGNIAQESPMHEDDLDTKLRQVCAVAGLPYHGTMYSFRRTALPEASSYHGQEGANDLAGHTETSEVLRKHYGMVSIGGVDIQGYQVGLSNTPEDEITEKPRQACASVS